MVLYLLAQAKCLNEVTKHFSGRGHFGVDLINFNQGKQIHEHF